MDIAKLVHELEFIARESKKNHADIESLHMQADSLLLEYINNTDVINAFCSIDRWYA